MKNGKTHRAGTKPESDAKRDQFLRRVELRMKQIDLTQVDLAKAIGRTQSTLSDWFNPEIRALPDGPAMLRLPEALGVNGEWLLTGHGPQQRPGMPGVVKEDVQKAAGAMEVIDALRRALTDVEKRFGAKIAR